MPPNDPALDLIAVGRSSVDLYGEQVGGRLENMASFAKYIGGSPTNTACGGARLGLKTGLVTRVGADHMGRFIREQLAGEGVDVTGVISDPHIVRHVRISHQQVIVADFRDQAAALGAAVNSNKFADFVPASDTRFGALALVLQILRRHSNGGIWIENIVFA